MRATIGQYEIKYELGSGGFGIVYAAVDMELGRWVAIKELRREVSANPALVERFRAEAISLAKLNHPNITALYHLLHPGDEWFLVMEMVQGQTLDKVLHRLRRLELAEAMAVIVQIAAGLGYANRMGVIHRDIKPANLMLTDTGQVKIMDFGIARIRGTQRLTRSGLLGTYAYLAPEQFRGGEGTERSDLYALACVAYEMLSGNIPFDAPTEAEMMRGHLEVPARSLRDILPGLNPMVDAAIQRALSKDPGARFANVEEFSDAIGARSIERQAQEIVRAKVLSRMPPPSRPTTLSDLPPGAANVRESGNSGVVQDATSPGPVPKPGLSRRMPAVVLGGAVAAVVVTASVILLQDRLTPESPLRQPDTVVIRPITRPADRVTTIGSSNTNTNVSAGAPDTVAPKRSETFIPPPHLAPSDKSLFLESQQAKGPDSVKANADALIQEAHLLIAKGDIFNAQVRLRRAADNEPRAFVDLGHLEDPTWPGRPVAEAAHPGQAARYYKEALEKNDTSVTADRDRLRQFLQDKANAGDYDARAVLQRYWP